MDDWPVAATTAASFCVIATFWATATLQIYFCRQGYTQPANSINNKVKCVDRVN